MKTPTLHHLEHWMKTVLATKGNFAEKLATAQHQQGLGIDEVVAPPPQGSTHRRLGIYVQGYVLRLLECMKSEYPLLLKFMGEQMFVMFAQSYILALPPQSWSLASLGKHFATFLHHTRPAQSGANQDMYDFPVALATFERAQSIAAQAKGTEQMAPIALPQYLLHLASAYDKNLVLHMPPCTQLLCLSFDVVDFVAQLELNPETPIPPRKTTYIAITRHAYRLQTTRLAHWQYALLEACAQPVALHQALDVAVKQSEVEKDLILEALPNWLPQMLGSSYLMQKTIDK